MWGFFYSVSAKNANGQTVACCGIEQCQNIEYQSKTYDEPSNNASWSAEKIGNALYSNEESYASDATIINHYTYNPYYSVYGYAKQRITFGVATKIPIGCSQESIETYDGIDYYHYKCASNLPVTNNLNLNFSWAYDNFCTIGEFSNPNYIGNGVCRIALVNSVYRVNVNETSTININGITVKIRFPYILRSY